MGYENYNQGFEDDADADFIGLAREIYELYLGEKAKNPRDRLAAIAFLQKVIDVAEDRQDVMGSVMKHMALGTLGEIEGTMQ